MEIPPPVLPIPFFLKSLEATNPCLLVHAADLLSSQALDKNSAPQSSASPSRTGSREEGGDEGEEDPIVVETPGARRRRRRRTLLPVQTNGVNKGKGEDGTESEGDEESEYSPPPAFQ